MFKNLKI